MAYSENQRTSAPYGDVYFMPTSKTDAFVANHLGQERQDEAMRQRELGDMDKQLSSHLGNVLNPDIPEIIQNWQNYKQAKKQLLFDPKIQKDPLAYAQKQIEVNKALADTMGLVGDSSSRKKALGDQLQAYYKKPYGMEDNFSDRFNMSLNTPTTFARQHPDFDNHYWQGPDMDFTKAINDAKGKQKVLKTTYSPVGTNGEYRLPTNISGTNTPEEFLGALNSRASDRKYATNAVKTLQNMSPEFIQQVNEHYAQLQKEKFEAWGYKDKPNLDPTSDDPVSLFNSIQAKTYAINHQFETKDGRQEVNPEVKRALNMADWKAKAGFNYDLWKKKESTRQAHRFEIKAAGGAGKADDEAYQWVTAGRDILKNGTPEQKEAYLSNLGTGGGKGVNFLGAISQGQQPVGPFTFPGGQGAALPAITYTKSKWVPVTDAQGNETKDGHWVDEKVTKQFDPEDPNLEIKLVQSYNEMKGKNLKLIRKNFNMDKASEAPKEKTKKEKKELTAEEILKQYDIKY